MALEQWRRMIAAVVAVTAWLALPAAAQAAAGDPAPGCVASGPAAGTVQRYTCTTKPVTVNAYEVLQNGVSAEALDTPKPAVDGFITAMDVDVVDAQGRPIPIDRLMLHHIVFGNLGASIGAKRDATCGQFTLLDSKTQIPAWAERFFGAGEERARLELPPGYGYQTQAADDWFLTYMFMNHRATRDRGFIRYHVTVDTAPDLVPVKPYWLDVRNCLTDPVFSVPGGGKPGSTWSTSASWTMPEGGRIVSAGGHVHGGAKRLAVTQPGCGGRALYTSLPAWGRRDHPFYNVKPVLHEPGPIAMSGILSGQGLPVAAGEQVTLTAAYDAELPHTRAMGISVLFLAPDPSVAPCSPLPADVRTVRTRAPHRSLPPRFTVPLTGLNDDGRAVRISRPPGPTTRLGDRGTVVVRDFGFSRPNVVVRPGTTLRWRFDDAVLHNVTLADGPRGFASPHLSEQRTYAKRFTVPGTYRLFCGLHPVAMTETVTVRR